MELINACVYNQFVIRDETNLKFCRDRYVDGFGFFFLIKKGEGERERICNDLVEVD